MSRRSHLYVPNGFYYVVQRSNSRQSIFCDPDDYAMYEQTLAATIARWDARIHAFCWLPSKTHFVLQVTDKPSALVVQQLSGLYARRSNIKYDRPGSLFQRYQQALLIDPLQYLCALVRYIHQIPIREQLVAELDEFRKSSHDAYLGTIEIPWLTTNVVLSMFNHDEHEARRLYSQFMRQPSELGTSLRSHERHRPDRILRHHYSLEKQRYCAGAGHSAAALDHLVASVATALGLQVTSIFSTSSGRELTLARAMIAWHAVERRIATRSDVARYLGRSISTLNETVSRYCEQRPELFSAGTLLDSGSVSPRSNR